MKILGPFLSVEDEDSFFFMRGFPDYSSPIDEGEVPGRRAVEAGAGEDSDADAGEV
jgi:hypothetical protein